MNKIVSSLIASSLLMAACVSDPSTPSTEGTDGPTTKDTHLQIAYIALEDNGASGPLVGCGDSEMLTQKTVEGTLNVKERINSALQSLLDNKEQFLGESGLYNALYQSTLTIDKITVTKEAVTVELSGETRSGGVCDDPRIVDQIRATIENNVDSEKTVTIQLNGNPLEKIQDLSGQ